MNFKKLIAWFFSMGITLSTGFTIKAMGHGRAGGVKPQISLAQHNRTFKQIKTIYTRLLNTLTFNSAVGEQLRTRSHGMTLGETFDLDVRETQSSRQGICRQFSNLLIYKLYNIGIEAYPLIVNTLGEPPHVAVLYKVDGHHYIADLSREIQYCESTPKFFKKNTPMLYKFGLREYIDADHDIMKIAFCNEILTDNPTSSLDAKYIVLYQK